MTQPEPANTATMPHVRVEEGVLRGSRSGGVDRYLGVPYAAAPVGDDRFSLPQRVAPRNDVRDCSAFGPTSPQLPYSGGMENFLSTVTIPGDEILNLAVWAPAASSAPSAERGTGHPVIVWIHGGSLTRGSNAIEAYDGTAFARDGIVFVSVNYRLGAEGFSVLTGADLNLGLADQVAALRWVRRNASSFGGDPSNVTVMGESAGALCIAALLALPDAASLFDRAIMQSGMPDARPRSQTRRISALMAKRLGIPDSREAFSSRSGERILAAQQQVTAGTNPITGGPAFALTVGDEFVPVDPAGALQSGAGSTIPLLIGTNSEEYRLWFMPTGVIHRIGWLHIAVAMFRFRISTRTVRLYRRNRPGATVGERFGALATDLLLRVPVNKLADARFARPGQATTHVYEFAWRSPVGDLGACHALEIGFVFDTLDSTDGAAMAGPTAPRPLADAMHAAWVRFARTGDPGWPAWNPYRR